MVKVLLVVGPSGVGKSRFARELMAAASTHCPTAVISMDEFGDTVVGDVRRLWLVDVPRLERKIALDAVRHELLIVEGTADNLGEVFDTLRRPANPAQSLIGSVCPCPSAALLRMSLRSKARSMSNSPFAAGWEAKADRFGRSSSTVRTYIDRYFETRSVTPALVIKTRRQGSSSQSGFHEHSETLTPTATAFGALRAVGVLL